MIDIVDRLERNPGPYVCIRREAAAEIRALRSAITRQVRNIERWLETGVPADATESREIYEQLKTAIGEQPK